MDELMEAIIEALEDFHSEMMAREITRAMRECQQRSESDPDQRPDVDPLRRHDRC